MAFTSANLISSVQRRAFLPTNQQTFSEEAILAIADEQIKSRILPNIMAVREEFFVHPIEQTIVAGTAAYNIHSRSVGMICREVQIRDAGGSITNLARIEPENVESSVAGAVTGFYLRNNQIVLHRTPSAAIGTLLQHIFLRPGDLVLTSAAGLISAIDTVLNTVTVSSIPSTWATGNIFDFVKQDGGQEYLAIESTSTDVTSNVITFSSLPTGLRVGDYVALKGTSPLLQMPPDYHPVIAQLTAADMLGYMNQPGAQQAKANAEKMLEAAQKLITPRVQGEDRVVQPVNWF